MCRTRASSETSLRSFAAWVEKTRVCAPSALQDEAAWIATNYVARFGAEHFLALDGKPALVVHECCTNLIREMEGYCWAPSKGAEVKDAPAPRQSDHAIDALRYICSKLARSTFAIG